jgi:hypothetical protein
MTATKIGKQEMKRLTKDLIQKRFEDAGFTAMTRSAGAVNYIALKPDPNEQYVAASIYGDRRGAASIWVKDEVLHDLKSEGKVSATDDRTIQDVSFFKRGMDWKIEIHNTSDTLIEDIVRLSTAWWNTKKVELDAKAAEAAEKARVAAEREAAMDAKRRSPF